MKRYITRHRLPTDHEREILTIVQEECAEIIVQISKALRFGLEDGYPGRGETNRTAIGREIGDLEAILAVAQAQELFRAGDVEDGKADKYDRLKQFMQTEPPPAPKPPSPHNGGPMPGPKPDDELIDIDGVLAMLPLRRAAWFYGIQQGHYPKPIKFGRLARWRKADIEAIRRNGAPMRPTRAR